MNGVRGGGFPSPAGGGHSVGGLGTEKIKLCPEFDFSKSNENADLEG